MAIKYILDKTKDVMKVVKDKTVEVIDKGNFELKKYINTKDISFISSPVIAGYETKKAFHEIGKLLFPVDEYDEHLFKINGIIRMEDDTVYYVIKDINNEPVTKTIQKDEKSFDYKCFTVTYSPLKFEFEKEVENLHLYALTEQQEEILNDIRGQINSKTVVLSGRKATCLDLWVYFVRCIQLHLKDHYTILAFTKLADGMVDDLSSKIVRLFVN